MPSHDTDPLYALLPLLAILAFLNPPAVEAVGTALGIVAMLKQRP